MAIISNLPENEEVGIAQRDYKNYVSEILDLPKTLMGGTRAMREAGETYLPTEDEETSAQYIKRKGRSILLNVYKRTVQKLTGEVFSQPITIDDGTSKEFKNEWSENIDMAGSDLNRFSFSVFIHTLADGCGGILVEYPNVKKEIRNGKVYYLEEDPKVVEKPEWRPFTQAVEKEKKWRPYWVHVLAENILGARFQIIDGITKMTMLRIKEEADEEVGRWGVGKKKQIRVLTIGHWELWEKRPIDDIGNRDTWMLVDEGNTNLNFIPYVVIKFGEEINQLLADPPLEDLAWLNLMHWQSSSDQRNILHYARVFILFGKMINMGEDGKLITGANKMILSNNESADMKVVEHSGKALEAGRQDLKDLEMQMAMFGLTYLMPKTGSVTATEKAIDNAENNSALKNFALIFEDALNVAVDYSHRMIGLKEGEGGKVKVNTEFRSFLRDYEAGILIEAEKERILPKRIVVEELRNRGIISTEIDYEELKLELEEERRNDPAMQTLSGGIFPKEKKGLPPGGAIEEE